MLLRSNCLLAKGLPCARLSSQIDAIAPTPLPAVLPLFATGLGGLDVLGWRRKRKAHAPNVIRQAVRMAAVAAAMTMASGVAYADTIVSFDLSGNDQVFSVGPLFLNDSLSGFLNFDSTTGQTSFGIATRIDQVVDEPGATITTTGSLFFGGSGSGSAGTTWHFATDGLEISIDQSTLTNGTEFFAFFEIPVNATTDSINPLIPSGTISFGGSAGVLGTISDLSVTETPLPASLPLFICGLIAFGLFGWRRKRKNAAAIAA
jgi:hypothetical protein